MSVIDMQIVDIDQIVDIEMNEVINNGGTKNYNDLNNKPMIEGVELVGNKTYEELNLSGLTNAEIEELLNLSV